MSAPADQPPNILLLISDHHRWDWLGCEGGLPLRTPHLDWLAAAGMRLRQCRVSTPMCAPSRAGLATGLRYRAAGVPDNYVDLDPRLPTFMQQLRAAGYAVEVSGKTDLKKKSTHLMTVDGWSQRLGQLGFTGGCDHAGKRDKALVDGWPQPIEAYMAYLHRHGLAKVVYDDYARRVEYEDAGRGVPTWPSPVARQHHIEDFGGRLAVQRLRGLPQAAPWFLQVNLGAPHPPFDAPQELVDRYAGVTFPEPFDRREEATDHQAVRRQFAAMLEQMDEWVGRLIDTVRERGELERTYIVYTSDHGDVLGEHGLWNKGKPHEPSVRVPLLVAGPDVPAATVNESALVEHIDLAATFVDWAGAVAPEQWHARSLAAVCDGTSAGHREVTLSAMGPWRMLTDGQWKLVDQDGTKQLFDLRGDDHETHDVAAAQPEQVERLAALLRREDPIAG